MTAAERAAAPLLPELPAREPGAPGQFAFAEPDRVRGILERSGWTGIEIRPLDVDCALPAAALDGYLTRMGPVGLALEGADRATRDRVLDRMRAGFAPYRRGAELRYTAACWLVYAGTPAAPGARTRVPGGAGGGVNK
jgi:hypothetical protein